MKYIPEIRVYSGVPTPFVDMIWGEFFVSRARGKNLSVHAPYLHDHNEVRSIVALNGGRIVGGLIVKDYLSAGAPPVSLIGFVCVRPEERGKHISRHLLQAAIGDARDRGRAGLVLWSGTPQVYTHLGFLPDPQDLLFQIAPLNVPRPASVSHLPMDFAPRGLPAFANGGVCLETPLARVTMLKTANGPTIAEWEGDDTDVLALLGAEINEPMWINALTTDSLPDAIKQLAPSPLRVVPSRRLALALGEYSFMDFPKIRLLDRI